MPENVERRPLCQLRERPTVHEFPPLWIKNSPVVPIQHNHVPRSRTE
jgi:hypothetical protein